MNTLITGGAGYIGSTVSNYLIDRGHQVTIIDNLSTGSIQNVPKKPLFLNLIYLTQKKLKKSFIKKNLMWFFILLLL